MKFSVGFSKILITAALSGAVGYLVAGMGLESPPPALSVDSTPVAEASSSGACEESGACCSSGLSQDDKVRLVSHNAAVAEASAQSGKKPNILIIWGDDIGFITSRHTTMGSWVTRRRISIGLPKKALCSPTHMASSHAPPVEPLSYSVSTHSEQDCSPSGCLVAITVSLTGHLRSPIC